MSTAGALQLDKGAAASRTDELFGRHRPRAVTGRAGASPYMTARANAVGPPGGLRPVLDKPELGMRHFDAVAVATLTLVVALDAGCTVVLPVGAVRCQPALRMGGSLCRAPGHGGAIGRLARGRRRRFGSTAKEDRHGPQKCPNDHAGDSSYHSVYTGHP